MSRDEKAAKISPVWIKMAIAGEVELRLEQDDYIDPQWQRGLVEFILTLPDDDLRFEALDDQLTPAMLSDYFERRMDSITSRWATEEPALGTDSYSKFVNLILIGALSVRLRDLRHIQNRHPDAWGWATLLGDEIEHSRNVRGCTPVAAAALEKKK